MVKIAPATKASPTDAVVRAMFCSRTPPPSGRKRANTITVAGNVAATVNPAFIPT